MIPAISTIALPAYEHADALHEAAAMGYRAVEVAPSRRWRDTWAGLTASDVDAYRREIEAAGLSVVGLHSLLYDQPDLHLFARGEARDRTLAFMTHLSALCRDLGGTTLIWGAGRNRGAIDANDAVDDAVAFFGDLIPAVENHGTCFCFEPLRPQDGDFVTTVVESIALAERIDHPSVRVQIDIKALAANDEDIETAARAAGPRLVHVHANEDALEPLAADSPIGHARMADALRAVGYDRFVSAEQKMAQDAPWQNGARASMAVLKETYCR
jgi:sugar phosphate isomerase/epimerase